MTLSNSYKLLLFLVIILGAIARIYAFWDMPLNLDERWHVYPAAISNSLIEAILYNAKFDGHPPIAAIWTYYFLQVSEHPFWLRLPSLLSGMALIFFGFILGRTIGTHTFNQKKYPDSDIMMGLILSTLFSLSYVTVMQSNVIRGYSIMYLVHAISIYCVINLDYTSKKKWMYIYTTLNIISLLSIHGSIMFSAAIYITYFIIFYFVKKNYRKAHAWSIANFIVFLAFIANYALTTIYGGARGVVIPKHIINALLNGIENFSTPSILHTLSNFIFNDYINYNVFYIVFVIVTILFLILGYHYKEFKKFIFLMLTCTVIFDIFIYTHVMELSPYRRTSIILIPCFVCIALSLTIIFNRIQKHKIIYFLFFVVLFSEITFNYTINGENIEEYYLLSEDNSKDFKLVNHNDIMIADGLSVLELLYPGKHELQRLHPFVRKLNNTPFPIYTYGTDFREVQSFFTIYDWQQFLQGLQNVGAFNDKKIIWFWRKVPPWNYDVQAEIFCDRPNYLSTILNKDLKANSLKEWDALTLKIQIEAMKNTPFTMKERSISSTCNHFMYGLSVDFIRKEILEKTFIDVNTAVEIDLLQNSNGRDAYKIRQLQRLFDNYRIGASRL